jgi:hypothetical protein
VLGVSLSAAVSVVIASEAKQSISPRSKYGLLRRFAPRNDGKVGVTAESLDSVSFCDAIRADI